MEKDYEESVRGLILRYCPGIRPVGLTKTMKNLSQGCRFPDRDLNPGPPEYET
jgi:hypothetical protein